MHESARNFRGSVADMLLILCAWVLDVQERQVSVFRQPGAETYQQETILNEDATISLVAFPDINISVNYLFP